MITARQSLVLPGRRTLLREAPEEELLAAALLEQTEATRAEESAEADEGGEFGNGIHGHPKRARRITGRDITPAIVAVIGFLRRSGVIHVPGVIGIPCLLLV